MPSISDPKIEQKLTEAVMAVAPINGLAMSENPLSADDVVNRTVDPPMNIRIDYRSEATTSEMINGDETARVFDLAAVPRRPRVLYAVYKDVSALTGPQKTNIGNDLFSGSPPKVATDTGPNAPDLLILWTLRQVASLSTADKRLLETDAISIYTLDNPNYLVSPPFDPSINVPGDEPAS